MYHSLEADQKSYPTISPLNTLDHKPSIDGSIWKTGAILSNLSIASCRGEVRGTGEKVATDKLCVL